MRLNQSTKYVAIVLALAAITVGAIFCYRSLSALVEDQSWVQHTMAVLTEIEGVRAALDEASLGARRFVAEGEEADAAASRAAVTRGKARIDALQNLTVDSSVQQKRIFDLGKSTAIFFEALDSALEKRAAGDVSGSAAVLKRNQITSDGMRKILAEMADEERSLLRIRTLKSQRGGMIAKGGLIAASLLDLILVAVFGYVIRLDFLRSQKLWESRTKLADLVDSSEDAIISTNLDGIISSWNRGAEGIYGYSTKEAMGKPISLLSPPNGGDSTREMLAQIRRGERVKPGEVVGIAKDGRQLAVWVTVSPVKELTGKIVGTAIIARDYTTQRQTESQLRQSQKLEAVGRLAAGVAHDFNNILAIIVGSQEILRPHVGGGTLGEKCLENIREASRRGAAMTRQLLAFSRTQVSLAGRQAMTFDLTERMQELSRLIKPLMGDDVEVAVLPRTELALVRVDPVQIDQVVMNLAVNARDAMPLGGRLAIEISLAELDKTFFDKHGPTVPGKYVLLAVSDTGSGMDEETVARIFDPFFTTKELGKGTGLGLSTVYGIVHQSQGYIWVYSEIGHGTTFKIYLPLRAVAEVAVGKAAEEIVIPMARAASILLVEDDERLREVTRQLLLDHGYKVFDAGDGEDALVLAASQAGAFELVLTDVVMRGMSGTQLVQELRVAYPKMRVVYMSGYTGDLMTYRSLMESGGLFLEKPFTKARLLNTVHGALGTADPEALIA